MTLTVTSITNQEANSLLKISQSKARETFEIENNKRIRGHGVHQGVTSIMVPINMGMDLPAKYQINNISSRMSNYHPS